jgi:NAD-dependent dihydropyrimidine dehydrogenase PreA subunit
VRSDGTFIAIEVDDEAARDAELAARLAEACPVDIYARRDGDGDGGGGGGGVAIVAQNVDECVLCRLCLDASPPGAVKVIKLYDGEALLQ